MIRHGAILLFLCFWGVKGYAQADSIVVVDHILLNGNKKTKPHIIHRELLFNENDSIHRTDLKLRIEQSRRNLLNASLFNFVHIQSIEKDTGHVIIIVDLIERWYIFPAPIFELADRNFNTWWLTRDFDRTNYGLYLYKDNFRGRKETIRLLFKHGYTRQYGFAYDIPYIDRNQQNGIGVMVSYARNRELTYGSFNNKQLFFKDENKYVREEWATRLRHTYRPGIFSTFTSEFKYNKVSIADTVLNYTSEYLTPYVNSLHYLSLTGYARYDRRNNKAYPLSGYFLDLELTQIGLNILENEIPSYLKIESWIKKYWKLSNRFYAASGFKGKVTTYFDQPYYLQRGLGYGDYVRGYEYYVIDGQNFGLLRSGLKYEIIKPTKKKFGFIPTEKFNTFHYALYAELFSDQGYVTDKKTSVTNPMANELLFSSGVGLHFVTYYDYVIRLEYSLNKLKEQGFFLHFSAPL